jgi:cell division protein FtsW (lipid II flippase)
VVALIIRLFTLCFRQKSILGQLVAISAAITFSLEVMSYVIFNLGFTMFSPLSLPLISYGGTAAIINMSLIGVTLSVFKSDKLVRDGIGTAAHENRKLFEIADGKIIIYYK